MSVIGRLREKAATQQSIQLFGEVFIELYFIDIHPERAANQKIFHAMTCVKRWFYRFIESENCYRWQYCLSVI